MKKFSIALATIATLAVAAPAVSSAQEIGVRIGGDRDGYRDRGDFRTHEFRGARADTEGLRRTMAGIAAGIATEDRTEL